MKRIAQKLQQIRKSYTQFERIKKGEDETLNVYIAGGGGFKRVGKSHLAYAMLYGTR